MIPCSFYPASEEVADFILQYSSRSPESLFDLVSSSCVNFVSREFAVIHYPIGQASPTDISQYSYAVIPKVYGLLDTTALEASGILSAIRQPAVQANGRGVLIGFVDTGIDYTDPLFRLADGSTRILSIWDQTIPGDEAPEAVVGFQPFYGSVYDKEAIDQALYAEDPFQIVPSRDTDGHGTFLAGVAAGGVLTEPAEFSGAAPEAVLAVVKLKPAKAYLRDFFLIPPDVPAYQENDIMAGISWLLGVANQRQLPLVICLGLGTSQGSHDGTSPLSLQLQALFGTRGLAVSVGAGNEAGLHHHYLGSIAQDQDHEDVELRVAQGDPGFCMELWARGPELYTVGFISPSGETIERIPLVLGQETQISFRLDQTRLTLIYEPYESGSGSQLVFFRFQDPAPGIWRIRVYPNLPGNGQFHIWLPMDGFVAKDTIFLRPDPDTTITDPGNALMPLTVAAYDHRNNSIYIHSSRGYNRLGLQKPDLAAPGVEVQGPGLPPAAGILAEPVLTRRTGTSVAAAIAAGAMAGIFSWGFTEKNDESLTGTSVKALLIRGADRNPSFSYPNRQWGYGTLDLYQSFLRLRE
ncbi:MAG TPA: S8 family peptidase [Candidatus Ventrimonas merdavium]|nr:S8 family peptidase [Candidatus Ventrimonas merdavium]